MVNPCGFDPQNKGSNPFGSAQDGESRFFIAMKGGKKMECKHEEIMCRNCVKICLKCGAQLPSGFIPGKAEETAETPVKDEKTTAKKTTRKKVAK